MTDQCYLNKRAVVENAIEKHVHGKTDHVHRDIIKTVAADTFSLIVFRDLWPECNGPYDCVQPAKSPWHFNEHVRISDYHTNE